MKNQLASGLTVKGGHELVVTDLFGKVNNDVGKFISLYGFDEVFDSLDPQTLKNIKIINTTENGFIMKIPDSIRKFVNLEGLDLENCVDSVPEVVCELKNIKYLSLVNDKKLKSLPECVYTLPRLVFLNLNGTDITLPENFLARSEKIGDNGYFVKLI